MRRTHDKWKDTARALRLLATEILAMDVRAGGAEPEDQIANSRAAECLCFGPRMIEDARCKGKAKH
jgi:hypothetical protein